MKPIHASPRSDLLIQRKLVTTDRLTVTKSRADKQIAPPVFLQGQEGHWFRR